MSDIDVDYETALSVAAALSSAVNNINPQIQQMSQSVTNLLAPDGGLNMQQTAPQINASYTAFTSSAYQCTQSINQFSGMFTDLVNSLKSIDSNYAYQIAHPAPS
jgi:uncharacterized protein YukE